MCIKGKKGVWVQRSLKSGRSFLLLSDIAENHSDVWPS